jgi:membrane protein implicated in regulation of membrane protease activity
MLLLVALVAGWTAGTWTATGTLALAVATFLVVLVAVFAEPLRRRHARTKVAATLSAQPPDLHQIEMTFPD